MNVDGSGRPSWHVRAYVALEVDPATLPQNVAAWAVAFIPLHEWVGDKILRSIWIVLAVAAPIAVGIITAKIVPARKQRGSLLRTVLSGYPLTLGMFLSFPITFPIAPVMKLASMARGWQDEGRG